MGIIKIHMAFGGKSKRYIRIAQLKNAKLILLIIIRLKFQ